MPSNATTVGDPKPLSALADRASRWTRLLRHGRFDYIRHALWVRWAKLDLDNVSVADLGVPDAIANEHAPTQGPFLRDAMRSIPIPSGSRILDLGCGKGAAMLEFRRMSFAEVAGVEISQAIANIAASNFRKLGLEPPTIHVCNATDFTDYDRFTHVYLYNPFPKPIIDAVIANLGASLARAPRPLTVIYYNPVHTDAFFATGKFRLTATLEPPLTHPFHILTA